MTLLEAKTDLARKLDISYTDIANNDLVSAADLQAWLETAVLRAWDYRNWPFTHGTKTVTTIDTDYYDQPSDLMPWSIFKLAVGGYDYGDPLTFEDYIRYKELHPTGTERKWAMHEHYLFVNKLSYTVGDTMDMTGKRLAPKLTDDADLLPFSPQTDNSEHSGNAAIVTLAYAEALASEKYNKVTEATVQERKAQAVLDSLWKPFAEMKSRQNLNGRPQFIIPDYFGSPNSNSNIGNFNI